jgi:predicted nucleotidyltransferase
VSDTGKAMKREIERAGDFARDLAGAYGDQLVTVALYGSAARGEYREGASDLNLLVLLADTAPATLRRGSALARAWAAELNPPPMIMSAAEFQGSADVFPIELADMRDAHLLLHGSDPFTTLRIDSADLRLQLERELKSAWLRLRTRYLTEAGDAARFEAVMLKSLSTFLVLFRTLLRVAGGAAPRDAEAVVSDTARLVGFDAAPLLQIVQARGGTARLEVRADAPVVTGYLEAVARVVEYVDQFQTPA